MINQELVDTARLLVAAVQDANDFSADYLRKLIVHLVPQLLGEIEILANVALMSERGLPAPVDIPEGEPKAKPGKNKKKHGGRKRRRK